MTHLLGDVLRESRTGSLAERNENRRTSSGGIEVYLGPFGNFATTKPTIFNDIEPLKAPSQLILVRIS